MLISYLDGGNFIPAGISGSKPASPMKSSLAFRSLDQNSSSPSERSLTSSGWGSRALCWTEYLMCSYSSWA